MHLILDIGSVIFAILAALFWLMSARVRLPNVPPEWSKTWANAHSVDFFRELFPALAQQSKMSATAAIFAAASAGIQGLLVFKY